MKFRNLSALSTHIKCKQSIVPVIETVISATSNKLIQINEDGYIPDQSMLLFMTINLKKKKKTFKKNFLALKRRDCLIKQHLKQK